MRERETNKMFEAKVMSCGAYTCRHNYDYGRCNKHKVAIDKEGKCILFDDIGLPTPPSEYGSYNEMDEHTNMC
jgi:hypothetical protein